MNQENKLREVIIEANPSILELGEGCRVKLKYGCWCGDIIKILYKINDFEYKAIKENIATKIDIRDCEIIGRDITLCDVLVAFDKWLEDKSLLPPEIGGKEILDKGGMAWNIKMIVQKWNLNKNNLKDQSPECKEFLSKLLL